MTDLKDAQTPFVLSLSRHVGTQTLPSTEHRTGFDKLRANGI